MLSWRQSWRKRGSDVIGRAGGSRTTTTGSTWLENEKNNQISYRLQWTCREELVGSRSKSCLEIQNCTDYLRAKYLITSFYKSTQWQRGVLKVLLKITSLHALFFCCILTKLPYFLHNTICMHLLEESSFLRLNVIICKWRETYKEKEWDVIALLFRATYVRGKFVWERLETWHLPEKLLTFLFSFLLTNTVV